MRWRLRGPASPALPAISSFCQGRPSRKRAMHMLASGVLAATAFVALHEPTAASTSFDGNWRVLATTTSGKCDPYLGYGLVIIDGQVLSREVRGVSGRVTPAGKVAVTMRRQGSTMTGSGRLEGGSGSGSWTAQSAAGRRVGEWRARRRA
jgi:hypothetical protein